MKKIVSFILAFVLCTSILAMPVSAAYMVNSGSQVPVINISGDGEPLYDANGNQIFKTTDILTGITGGGESEDGEDNAVVDAIVNVLKPFLFEGILKDEWDNYYDNLYNEMADLFKDSLLNKDGTAPEGTGLSQWRKDYMLNDLSRDSRESSGHYGQYDYCFFYDWRLDPWYVADQFNDYIEAVKKVTGAPKVAITAKCLGTNVVLAYVAKYGAESIHGLGFDGGTVNGMEPISEAISGKFKVDGNAITRTLIDCNYFNVMNVDQFIIETMDMVTKSGIIDSVVGITKEYIYYKVVEGVTSALALSTVMTWPGYWAAVADCDYETAIRYCFGPEDSEKRTEYAGLIEKLDNYNVKVRSNINSLLTQIKESGANVIIIAKYGCQMIPTCESATLVADQFVSVKRASFGATTSTIYNTLSDEYISAKIAEGKGKYISPDKQIDASTCLFPDYTWFIKGNKHSNWSWWENDLTYTVVSADSQLTVDDFDFSQFVVYNKNNNFADKMTTENCNTEVWEADINKDEPKSFIDKIKIFFESFAKWFKSLISIISEKINSEN